MKKIRKIGTKFGAAAMAVISQNIGCDDLIVEKIQFNAGYNVEFSDFQMISSAVRYKKGNVSLFSERFEIERNNRYLDFTS